ncbi:MAG: hypothetical protein COB85_09175 [Bacteroidetes bacterium]|nr:MAG: hypothetical protein COB85_09175 [Bacteroidota bacterium]
MRTLIILFTLIILASDQNTHVGIYSTCWGGDPKAHGCMYIQLFPDSSFEQRYAYHIGVEAENYGRWNITDDTLILNNNLIFYKIRCLDNREADSDTASFSINLMDNNSLIPASEARVIVNQDSTTFLTDFNGIISFPKGGLSSLTIKYVGCKTVQIPLSEILSSCSYVEIALDQTLDGQREFKNEKWLISNDSVKVVAEIDSGLLIVVYNLVKR